MGLIVLGSIAGSPGVTRLAVGLAAGWPEPARERVLVEADADGGRLGALLGVGVEPGLMELAMAARTSGLTATALLQRGSARVGEWSVIPAPASSEQTASALSHAAGALANTIATDRAERVWIVDAGRLSVRSPALPFARLADQVLLVTSGSFPELQLVAHRADALRATGCAVAVVVVEPTSWSAAEIAEFVGAEVLTVVPYVRVRDVRLSAMSSTAWRGWWRCVGDLAVLLAGGGHDGEVASLDPVGAVVSQRNDDGRELP